MEFENPLELRILLEKAGYFADDELTTALFAAVKLDRPLLVEGEAGVGKTSLATSLAEATVAPLMRLQCYEGLELNQALYEWNYAKQLLAIRLAESGGRNIATSDIFSIDYLCDS
jgi:MoxR-like ATPase